MSSAEEIKTRLLAETARCGFHELQRFFAQGKLLHIDSGLDLLDVGVVLAMDRTSEFQIWLDSGQVSVLEDRVAQRWLLEETELWAAVVKPWVLVQVA